MDVNYREEKSSWHSMAQMRRRLFVCIVPDFLSKVSEMTSDETVSVNRSEKL